MIIETSVLVAIVLGEDDAYRYIDAILAATDDLRVSAASLFEAAMVVESRQGPEAGRDLDLLVGDMGLEIHPVDAEMAQRARNAWRRFGKARHPAGLNFGDCFAYALATALGEPLLFKGADFAQTDVISAL